MAMLSMKEWQDMPKGQRAPSPALYVTIESVPYNDMYTACVRVDSPSSDDLLCCSPSDTMEQAQKAALEYRKKLGLNRAYRAQVWWLKHGDGIHVGSTMDVVLTDCADHFDALTQLHKELESKSHEVTKIIIEAL